MTADEATTFQFGFYGAEASHGIGDEECAACWSGYPMPCDSPGCTGLVHAHFGDETYDSETGEEDWWLEYCCDQCGETEPS